MRGLVGLLVCAVVAACGSAPDGRSVDADPAAGTFTSPIYGYSVELPSGWSATPAKTALRAGDPPATGLGVADVIGVDPTPRVGEMDPPVLIVAAQPVASGTELGDWESSVIATVDSMKGCGQPGERTALDIDGEPGVILTYPDCPPDLGLLHLWAAVVHDGRGFHIVWFNEPGHEPEDEDRFIELLSTWSFE